MLYSRKGFPEQDEILLCKVTKMFPNSVFVDLLEYENKQGMIHISEIDHRIVDNPKEVMKINETVKVKIIEVKDFSDFKQKFLIEDWNLKIHWKLKIENLDQDCLILFTSGTTALPKGVRLTLTSLFANTPMSFFWKNFFIGIPKITVTATGFIFIRDQFP